MKPGAKDTYRRLMVLKFVISHSYRSRAGQYLGQGATHWSAAEIKHFENELENESVSIISSMKQFDLWDYTSATEKAFFSTPALRINEKSHMNMSWRMEAAIILMWALHLIDKFPDNAEQTNPELLKLIEIKKLELLSNAPPLRSHEEITRVRDIAELWHWRVNTRRLIEDNYDFQPDEKMIQNGITNLDAIIKLTAKSALSKGDVKEITDEDFSFRGQAFRDLSFDDFSEATSIIIERHYALNWLCGFAPNNDWDETPTDT